MKVVELLSMTPHPMQTIILAARTCKASVAASDSEVVQMLGGGVGYNPYSLTQDLIGPKDTQLVKHCIEEGHESILEHVTLSFKLTMSRVAHTQLVRHRLLSISAESARAVMLSKDKGFFIPGKFKDRAAYILDTVIGGSVAAYMELIDLGVPMEDARYVLPMALVQPMVVTANLREWRHVIAERCCKHAQTEIRELIGMVRKAIKEIHPLFVYKAEKHWRCKHKDECKACLEAAECL